MAGFREYGNKVTGVIKTDLLGINVSLSRKSLQWNLLKVYIQFGFKAHITKPQQ